MEELTDYRMIYFIVESYLNKFTFTQVAKAYHKCNRNTSLTCRYLDEQLQKEKKNV